MFKLTRITVIFTVLYIVFSHPIPRMHHSGSRTCERTSVSQLKTMLGTAYHPRYMAIQNPTPNILRGLGEEDNSDRYEKEYSEFAVGRKFKRTLHEKVERFRRDVHSGSESSTTSETTTKFNQTQIVDEKRRLQRMLDDMGSIRPARRRDRVSKYQFWTCPSKEIWLDLGEEYFPRYLRTLNCTCPNCWYSNHETQYKCRGLAFTVKILRRLQDCVFQSDQMINTSVSREQQLVEDWVFEEHAVNFYCECVPPVKYS